MIELVMCRRTPRGQQERVRTESTSGAEIASFWIRGGNTSRELNKLKPGEAGKIVYEQKAAM